MARDESAFDDFVRARLPHLLRLGRALTGNDAAAGSLVGESLARVLAPWSDSSAGTAEQDVRRVMVARSLGRSRIPPGADDPDTLRDAEAWESLTSLSAKQRAMVALLWLEDLPTGQAADVMGCSDSSARQLTDHVFLKLDEQRVRRALDEPVNLDETRLLIGVRQESDRRRRKRTLLISVVTGSVLLAATVTGVVAAAQGDPEVPPGLADPATALSVSDAKHVFVVTDPKRCTRCSDLWVGDGTESGWKKVYTFDQPGFVAELKMAANGKDGFAWFGRNWLEATHDGGKSWVVPGIDLREGDVDIQIAGTTVWALLSTTDGPLLWRSEIGTDDWSEVEVAAPASLGFALATLGDQIFKLDYLDPGPEEFGTNLLSEVTNAGQDKRGHPLPCPVPPLPPRSSAAAMWLTCPEAGQGVRVARSTDGIHWDEVGVSESSADGSFPISDQRTLMVTSTGARIVDLAGLTDVPLEREEEEESISDGFFVTPEVGTLITSAGRVLRSVDGGLTWTEIG